MKYQGAYPESVTLARVLAASEGGTYVARGKDRGKSVEYDRGFAVGGARNVPAAKFAVLRDPELTIQRIARWLDALPLDVDYVGAWQDDGIVYIDAVEVIDSYIHAYATALERDELAIWSFGKQDEVRVG